MTRYQIGEMEECRVNELELGIKNVSMFTVSTINCIDNYFTLKNDLTKLNA